MSDLQTKYDKKVETLLNTILSKKSNNKVTHNKGKLIRGNHEWGEFKHEFVDGIYLRQMILNPLATIISGIHKRDHVWILLEGIISVASAEGTENYEAPYVGFSKAGTQRIIYAHEYSIFQNIFKNPTNNKNLDYVEKYNYALNKQEYYEYIKNK
tara:strand:+ start:1021 stop:1485 length:465 start_codon:yes stop_codon:yes gene_type:complete